MFLLRQVFKSSRPVQGNGVISGVISSGKKRNKENYFITINVVIVSPSLSVLKTLF